MTMPANNEKMSTMSKMGHPSMIALKIAFAAALGSSCLIMKPTPGLSSMGWKMYMLLKKGSIEIKVLISVMSKDNVN